jgi:hypothetical protein
MERVSASCISITTESERLVSEYQAYGKSQKASEENISLTRMG